MGFGDVKLSGVLGMYTAWLGLGRLGGRAVPRLPPGRRLRHRADRVKKGGRKTACPSGRSCCSGADRHPRRPELASGYADLTGI
jgi:hypothetical protein